MRMTNRAITIGKKDLAKRLLVILLMWVISHTLNCRKSDVGIIAYDDFILQIELYPREIKFNNEIYSSNVMLAWSDYPLNDFHAFILRAAWTDDGSVIQIEAAPSATVGLCFSGSHGKAQKARLISTRFVKQSEMKFIEKPFIQSLPLMLATSGLWLTHDDAFYFRVSPEAFDRGSVIGYFWDDVDKEFNNLNPGYAKLVTDFKNAIPWIFAEWLIEDGHKINKKWLARMKSQYPKQQLN